MHGRKCQAIGFGVITLRRSERATSWFRCDPLPDVHGPCGADVTEGLALRSFLEAHREDAALLGARLRRAATLRWEQTHEASATGWSPSASRVRRADGLAFALNLSPDVVAWLGRCRGDRRLGEHLKELAQAAGQHVNAIAPGFLRIVRHLVEAGLLVPADG